MKRYTTLRRGILAAGLAAGLLVSCGREDTAGDGGRPFAAGEHPVTLAAAVAPATRATSADAWTGGEQVAVEAATDAGGAAAEVKTYTADSDSRLTSGDPFWWQRSDERKRLRAWYCGDGSSAAGEAHASAVPTAWSVQSDQSGEGFQQSDLLFAPATTAAFAGDAAVPLHFYHQTAKVVVNIKNAEYVTDAAQIRSVAIGDGDLTLSARFTAPTDDATAGTWEEGAAADGTIAPHTLTAPTDPAKYVASYEALVIPQPTAGRRMVAVETEAGTMYYTAPDDAPALAAGKVRTYNITVRADRLEVSVANGDGEWTDGGSEEVTTNFVYTASDLKFGDYFYSDGTTSDGGLRKRWPDGRIEVADPKPAPEMGEGRTVVGIVFQTDPSRIGDAEKAALAAKGVDTPHGLVMAVKKAAKAEWWSLRTYEDTGATVCKTVAACYNDIGGLKNTRAVYALENYRTDADNYPAFKSVADFNAAHAVPKSATEWFMPSAGQLWDLLENLGKVKLLKEQRTNSQRTWSYSLGIGDVCANLNGWLADVAGADRFEDKLNYFWSSSEDSGDYARYWYVSDYGRVTCCWSDKFCACEVRTVLAF